MAGTQPHGTQDSWHALLRDGSLQFQFPDVGAQPSQTPGWLQRTVQFLAAHWHAIKIGAGIAVALLAVACVIFLVRRFLRRQRTPPETQPQGAQPAWQPTAQQATLLLSDADALAAQGLYAEAVHRLLLVAIQEIAQRRPGLLLPSLTSREIAMLPELSALAQRIFFAIALVVEQSRFGNRPLGAAEYGACRAAFGQFTGAGTWQVAA